MPKVASWRRRETEGKRDELGGGDVSGLERDGGAPNGWRRAESREEKGDRGAHCNSDGWNERERKGRLGFSFLSLSVEKQAAPFPPRKDRESERGLDGRRVRTERAKGAGRRRHGRPGTEPREGAALATQQQRRSPATVLGGETAGRTAAAAGRGGEAILSTAVTGERLGDFEHASTPEPKPIGDGAGDGRAVTAENQGRRRVPSRERKGEGERELRF